MELVFCSNSNSFLRGKRRGKQKSKKGGSRSQMLKVVMPKLSGSNAEELQRAIAANDGAKAERILHKIAAEIRKDLEDN